MHEYNRMHYCILIKPIYSYKHAVDGLIQVFKHEGSKRLFSGATMATSRAVLMTVGQVFYYFCIEI